MTVVRRVRFEEVDALAVISALDKTGIDLIDISGGTYFPGAKSASDGAGSGPYFLYFAKRARERTGKPLMVTGGFKTFFGSKKGVDHCAVYFINKKKHVQVKWGTPHRIDVHDKGFDMYTSVGAHGTYSFTIVNPLKLFSKMKIFEESLTKDMINQYFSEEIAMYLRKAITHAFSQNKKGLRDIAEITSQETKIANSIKTILDALFYSYGVKLEKFVISKIDYDKKFMSKIKEIRQQAVYNKYSEENELVKKVSPSKTNTCEVCGHKNPKDAQFCGNCGSKIKTEITCPSCQKKLPKDAKFCHHCGSKVVGE